MPAGGPKVQFAPNIPRHINLDKRGKQKIQSIVGTFLFCVGAVESTILTALNNLAIYQANPTTCSYKKAMLLDYLAAYYPSGILHYYAGNKKTILNPMQRIFWSYQEPKAE